MAGEKGPTKRSAMDIKRLASLIQRGAGRLLVIDSRTFSEYNASHVQGAINVCCSKLVKRRLQQDKVSVTELLQPNGKVKVRCGQNGRWIRVCVNKRAQGTCAHKQTKLADGGVCLSIRLCIKFDCVDLILHLLMIKTWP